MELHTKGFANPGTTEIESLFKTIGITQVWDEFARLEPDMLVKSSVDAIVNRRNQIAHGNLESTVTRADVETYLTRAQRLAEIMDQLVDLHICSRLSISNVWTLLQGEGGDPRSDE